MIQRARAQDEEEKKLREKSLMERERLRKQFQEEQVSIVIHLDELVPSFGGSSFDILAFQFI